MLCVVIMLHIFDRYLWVTFTHGLVMKLLFMDVKTATVGFRVILTMTQWFWGF